MKFLGICTIATFLVGCGTWEKSDKPQLHPQEESTYTEHVGVGVSETLVNTNENTSTIEDVNDESDSDELEEVEEIEEVEEVEELAFLSDWGYEATNPCTSINYTTWIEEISTNARFLSTTIIPRKSLYSLSDGYVVVFNTTALACDISIIEATCNCTME